MLLLDVPPLFCYASFEKLVPSDVRLGCNGLCDWLIIAFVADVQIVGGGFVPELEPFFDTVHKCGCEDLICVGISESFPKAF